MKRAPLSWLIARSLPQRVAAIDALRGLAIGGMILVNHPGSSEARFAPLVHAAWNGWTLADTIFPAFLLVVGLSISLSMTSSDGRPVSATPGLYAKVFRRAGLLVLLNVALVNFPYYDGPTAQLTGTLTTIAICSVAASLACLHLTQRGLAILLMLCLAVHWLLTAGLGVDVIRTLDSLLLGSHFRPDAETGLESLTITLGACASTFIGVLTGRWLALRTSPPQQRVADLLAVGFALCLVGSAWSWIYPINKPTWSASYVLLMAGLSLLVLGALLRIESRPAARTWLRPFEIAGLNALVFYVGAQSLQRILVYGRFETGGGEQVRLRPFLFEAAFNHWADPRLGSLLFAFVFLLVCYGFVYCLYRARIFVKL